MESARVVDFFVLAKLFMLDVNEDVYTEFGPVLVTMQRHEVTKELGLLIYPQEVKSVPIFFSCSPDSTYQRRNDARSQYKRDLTVCTYMCSVNILRHMAKDSRGLIGCMQRDWHFTNHQGGSHDTGIGCMRKLPPVKLSHLRFLSKKILECKFSDQVHIAELIAQDDKFFPKLVSLFKCYEDSENIDGLHVIYQLIKSINDPEKSMTVKEHHRSLLETSIKEHVICKEDLPVKHKSVFTTLYQSYVAGYIKDVILLGTLDEVSIASLTVYAHAKYSVVYSVLKDDSCFIQELRAKLQSDGISADSKRDLVLFFCELWSFNECAENVRVPGFWWKIVDGETYNIIVSVMQDIISQNDDHCLRRIVKNNLFRLIIEIFYDVANRFHRLHGGVLDLLEYMATENVKVLVIHLWETFSEKLEEFEQFKGIQSLKIKYNQCLEDSEQKTQNHANVAANNRAEDRGLEKEAAEGSCKEYSWTSQFYSFCGNFLCEKEKITLVCENCKDMQTVENVRQCRDTCKVGLYLGVFEPLDFSGRLAL